VGMDDDVSMVEDWEKQILNILSDEKGIKSSSKITAEENAYLRTQLFFGRMLKDDNIINCVDDQLKLNKSDAGWFSKIIRDVMKGKIERDRAVNDLDRALQ